MPTKIPKNYNSPLDVRRFFSYINIPEDNSKCWLWKGGLSNGYAQFSCMNQPVYGHVYIWTYIHGPILKEKEIHHKCGVRKCVNIVHMELLTHAEHMGKTFRFSWPIRTHCKNGHEFTEENTLWRTHSKSGYKWQVCRICNHHYYLQNKGRW